jgi:transcriptional regulator with XRE-family HTH domain
MLKEARLRDGLTQAGLAKQCGLSQDWISHIECGRRLPDAYAFYRLMKSVRTRIVIE